MVLHLYISGSGTTTPPACSSKTYLDAPVSDVVLNPEKLKWTTQGHFHFLSMSSSLKHGYPVHLSQHLRETISMSINALLVGNLLQGIYPSPGTMTECLIFT